MATAKKTATTKKTASTKKIATKRGTVRRPARPLVTPRRDSVLDTVKRLGLLDGPRNRIADGYAGS